jgi:hypothetical protein
MTIYEELAMFGLIAISVATFACIFHIALIALIELDKRRMK